ncbi:MAG TPA: glycoside hydrolase family 18, partial [Firmicutes bacterium]|nr:glycoside hydrolase family 18 [Bacillota bacterium]
ENFPLLLKAIRQKLAEQQQIDGKYYTLSIAGAANPSFINNSQIGWAHKYLDFVQVMTYDIHGTWENLADFTAPLYDDEGKTWSVAQAVEAYLAAGVPKEKLVMGVPFYGYRYNVASAKDKGLRQPFTNAEAITYNALAKNDLLGTGYERYWDEGTKVPYLFNAEKLIFISHDDEESITLKAEYIKEQDLAGAMIWELSQDHGIDLLDSLYQVLKD